MEQNMALVRIDNTGKVIEGDRRIRLSKIGNEQIHWSSQLASGPWTVIFPAPTSGPPAYSGSPFSASTFTVPPIGSVASGEVVVSPSGTEYKYEVRDSQGTLTDDPDVLIEL
jgi:hypothetical protein